MHEHTLLWDPDSLDVQNSGLLDYPKILKYREEISCKKNDHTTQKNLEIQM